MLLLSNAISPFGGIEINIDRSVHVTVQPQIVIATEDIRAVREPRVDADVVEEVPSGTKILTFEGSDSWCPVWPVGKLETGWVLPRSLLEPEG